MLSASASGPRSLKNTTKSLEAPRRHRRTIWSVFCYATRMRVRVRRSLIVRAKGPFSETGMSAFGKAYGAAFRGCEQITFNAETAEAAEKKCLRISLRALRALRSSVAFFHRLFRIPQSRIVSKINLKTDLLFTRGFGRLANQQVVTRQNIF